MANLKLSDDTFGPLLPYVEDKDVTDIRWDGNNLWVDNLKLGKIKTGIKLDEKFINKFTQRVADSSNASFNASSPVLEGETDALRIACLHESKTNTGTAITIRKTEAECRLNDTNIINEGYLDKDTLELLKKLVQARCSFVITGDTGSGKTELVKYLMRFIDDKVTTLTLEDNYELRAKALRPDFDCTEIKFDTAFTPTLAIKAALRQNTKWLILSESRSREAAQLLEAASTGCSVMTTIHSWDVRNIPERFENMIGETNNDVKNDVYNFFDVGVLIVKKEVNGITRHVEQIGFFDHQGNKNETVMLMEYGKLQKCRLPEKIRNKFNLYDVEIPKGFFDNVDDENYTNSSIFAHSDDSSHLSVFGDEYSHKPTDKLEKFEDEKSFETSKAIEDTEKTSMPESLRRIMEARHNESI